MNQPNVVIVARSPFNLSLMAELLEANSIQTIRRTSARDLAKVATQRPSMVVVDTDLPGDEVQEVVADCEKQDVPVMVIHPRGQREMAEKVVADYQSLLEKPIDTGRFPRRVIQEIRRHSRRQESLKA